MPIQVMLTGLTLAQLADATTFTLGVSIHGIGLESNAFAVTLYRFGGLDAVLWAKCAAIVLMLVVLATTAHRFPRLLTWGSAVATSLGLLGFLANVASLAILSG